MAKDRFQPSKPHVNVAAVALRLQSWGFSAGGARQVAQGQLPAQLADRQLLVSRFLQLSQESRRGAG